MSDSPFQRPGSEPRSSQENREGTTAHPTEFNTVDLRAATPAPRESRSPQPRGTRRAGALAAAGLVGALAGGLGVAAFTVGPPRPDPLQLTVDQFPREVFGEEREDLQFRDTGSKAVIQRLDAAFQHQLTAHRFAYGGDGAEFRYGHLMALTIVNGRLAPAVPVAGGGVDWEATTVVSLQSGDTSCVAEPPEVHGDRPPIEITLEPGTGTVEMYENDNMVWTDCVLVDTVNNLSLRLSGRLPLEVGDVINASRLNRDELRRIHATLID
ncbi:MAG: hypothetical protein Q4P15_00010 [Propionibacteriaceae bacterium]|nr:hypothetical protein [Propionibacteriaceae bacterium]